MSDVPSSDRCLLQQTRIRIYGNYFGDYDTAHVCRPQGTAAEPFGVTGDGIWPADIIRARFVWYNVCLSHGKLRAVIDNPR